MVFKSLPNPIQCLGIFSVIEVYFFIRYDSRHLVYSNDLWVVILDDIMTFFHFIRAIM